MYDINSHTHYTSIPAFDFKPFLFNCFSDWSLGASVLVCHTYTCKKEETVIRESILLMDTIIFA
jgi:hypothetical protein